jgi:hypothetical protein
MTYDLFASHTVTAASDRQLGGGVTRSKIVNRLDVTPSRLRLIDRDLCSLNR